MDQSHALLPSPEATAAANVQIEGSNVEGDVQVRQSSGTIVISGNTVDGDVQLEGNSCGETTATVSSNTINGHVQVNDNTRLVVVADNIIAGDLRGVENDPAPIGEGNTVNGNIDGQFELQSID